MNFVPYDNRMNVFHPTQHYEQPGMQVSSSYAQYPLLPPQHCYVYPPYHPSLQYRNPCVFPEDDHSSYCSPEQYSPPADLSNQSSPANIASHEINSAWIASDSIANSVNTCSPGSQKGGSSVEHDKKGSELWKMLNEINDMDDLAINMSGTKPIPDLRVEDIEEFEMSDNTNVEMPTDDLIINLNMEDAQLYSTL